MSTPETRLGAVPENDRAKELWLQNSAGYLLFDRVRARALEAASAHAEPVARAAAAQAVDDTLYALMMLADGVLPPLQNETCELDLHLMVQLRDISADDDEVIEEIDLGAKGGGDGACMGFHGWVAGDFGDDPVTTGG